MQYGNMEKRKFGVWKMKTLKMRSMPENDEYAKYGIGFNVCQNATLGVISLEGSFPFWGATNVIENLVPLGSSSM